MNKNIVRYATKGDKQKWDTFVYPHPDASPYQLFSWKEAVESAYGHQSSFLIAEKEGRLSGVLPLFIFKIPLVSKSIVSLPYCDLGDVLADSEESRNLLIEKAISLIYGKKSNSLEIRSCRENIFRSAGRDIHVTKKSEKVRMLLDLPKTSEDLWNGFKSKLRSQVRKSERNGLRFSWGTKKDVDDFYHVFSCNMRDLGSPVHSKRWISSIIQAYGKNAKMGLVYFDKVPVGCGIILGTQYNVSIPWASTLKDYNHLAPNMMLYWNFLKYAADSGRQQFDFGRSTPFEGTYRFKRQWGAKPVNLYWHYAKDGEWRDKKQGNLERRFVEDLWKKCPITLTNIVGPMLRKYISL